MTPRKLVVCLGLVSLGGCASAPAAHPVKVSGPSVLSVTPAKDPYAASGIAHGPRVELTVPRVKGWSDGDHVNAIERFVSWQPRLDANQRRHRSYRTVAGHVVASQVRPRDVVSFLQMLVVVLLGFTGALAMVFWQDVVPLAVNGECDGLIGDGTTWWSISKKLFEGSMLGDAPFLECIELSNHYWTGLVLTYTFTVIVVVLLLNSMPIGARTQIW